MDRRCGSLATNSPEAVDATADRAALAAIFLDRVEHPSGVGTLSHGFEVL